MAKHQRHGEASTAAKANPHRGLCGAQLHSVGALLSSTVQLLRATAATPSGRCTEERDEGWRGSGSRAGRTRELRLSA